MRNLSDQELIDKYLKGDEKSLEILIQRHLKSIYNFAHRYTGDIQEAEDITQDVFVKAWRNLKKPVFGFSRGFDPKKGNFKAWLFSIAKNACLDFLKKKRAIPLSDFENKKGENLIAETFADPVLLPEEIIAKKELTYAFADAAAKLPLKYQKILFLRHNDDFTFRQIAEFLNEPLNTIKSRYRRALLFLRKLLFEA